MWPFPLAGTLPAWLVFVLSAADFIIRVLALGIIPGNRRPTTAMAWLLGIFFVPAVGLILFLLFGNFRLSRRRVEQQQLVSARLYCPTSEATIPAPNGSSPPPNSTGAWARSRWWTATPWNSSRATLTPSGR